MKGGKSGIPGRAVAKRNKIECNPGLDILIRLSLVRIPAKEYPKYIARLLEKSKVREHHPRPAQ